MWNPLYLVAWLLRRKPIESASMNIDPRHKVLIYEREADRLALLTLQYPNIETGGDLFGYWTHSGSPVVSYVIGPGRQSRHNLTSFYQDEAYLHDVGTDLYDRHGIQHVGEWHSHHRLGLNVPSEGDLATVRSGMNQKQWPRFLLLITTIGDEEPPSVFQNYFLFSVEHSAPESLRMLLLAGSSPFRTNGDDHREEEIRRSGEAAWRPGPSAPATRQVAADVFRQAWFTTPAGQALLLRAARQFAAAGIDCRMIPTGDGRALRLELPEAALLLGADFPQEPPKWVGPGQSDADEPWSPSTELADWYIRARQKHAPHAPVTTPGGGDAHGVDD